MSLKSDFSAGHMTWASKLNLLSLSFLVYKMKIVIVPNKSAIIIGISDLIRVKHLE